MQGHKLGVRHLMLQLDAIPQLWSSSDDKTVKVWAVSDDVCSGGGTPTSSIMTITLPCVALVCEAVELHSEHACDDDKRSVWIGCDDHMIRVWSCKRQQFCAELKNHKVVVAFFTTS
jgi:hypothetical protein